jgi:hypothetical protein
VKENVIFSFCLGIKGQNANELKIEEEKYINTEMTFKKFNYTVRILYSYRRNVYSMKIKLYNLNL